MVNYLRAYENLRLIGFDADPQHLRKASQAATLSILSDSQSADNPSLRFGAIASNITTQVTLKGEEVVENPLLWDLQAICELWLMRETVGKAVTRGLLPLRCV